uniref:DUF5681 domain-containing protein n=1 Tax=viral metagenome TaxID=1070528 RepID=A0A6M3IGT4_9ZZZZ
MADKQAKSKRKMPQGNPWKPGQSGNPAGRPKKINTIPDILRSIGEEEGTRDGKYTKLDVVMRKVFEFALDGKSWAVQFIAERTEGKVTETHEIIERQPIPINLIVKKDD